MSYTTEPQEHFALFPYNTLFALLSITSLFLGIKILARLIGQLIWRPDSGRRHVPLDAFVAMVCIVLSVCLMLIIVLPITLRRNEYNPHRSCYRNLQMLSLVMKIYSNESNNAMYPPLSSQPGHLMFEGHSEQQPSPIYPEYFTQVSMMLCPSDPDTRGVELINPQGDWNLDYLLNDESYFYLGYAITDDVSMLAFLGAYSGRIASDQGFQDNIPVVDGSGTFGSNTLYRLSENIPVDVFETYVEIAEPEKMREEYYSADATMQSEIPVIIERSGNHTTPDLITVLYLDGHQELHRKGTWPYTDTTMQALAALDNLGSS